MTARMKDGVPQADGTIATEPTMDVGHVARAVVYMAGLPLDANVLLLTLMATKMPFVGRGSIRPGRPRREVGWATESSPTGE